MPFEVDTYRDGGTVRVTKTWHEEDPFEEGVFISVKVKFFIDSKRRRVDEVDTNGAFAPSTKFAIYPDFPDKCDPITPDQYNEASLQLFEGVKCCRSPNEVIAIGRGLEWIYDQ